MWPSSKTASDDRQQFLAKKASELLREQEHLLEKRMDAADMVLYDSRSQLISVLIRELTVESEPGM